MAKSKALELVEWFIDTVTGDEVFVNKDEKLHVKNAGRWKSMGKWKTDKSIWTDKDYHAGKK